MGTGSFGGAGSGVRGRGGSGAGYASRPRANGTGNSSGDFFSWRDDGTGRRQPNPAAAATLVRDTFAQRGVGAYVHKMVSSEAVRGCFEELFRVSPRLTQFRDWTAIAREYGVADGPGCLNDLADAIRRRHMNAEPELRFRELAASTVADVLLMAIGQDDDIYMDGRAADIFAALKPKVFESLSGHYLGLLLYHAARCELPGLADAEVQAIRRATQERADLIIAKFRHAFVLKQKSTYRQLLETLAGNRDWFLDKLREPIEV